MIDPVLLDNSAWTRLASAALPETRRAEIAEASERGELHSSLPFLLEAGYSVRSAKDHDAVMDELLALPRAVIDSEVEQRALDAQGQLARSGHHRIPPADLLLAALADREGVGILHYDRDYDVIRERTDLRYESVWLAEPGAL